MRSGCPFAELKGGPWDQGPKKVLPIDIILKKKARKLCFRVLTSPDFINRIQRFMSKAVSTASLLHPYSVRKGALCVDRCALSFSSEWVKKIIIN
jgi:hypothetical protein